MTDPNLKRSREKKCGGYNAFPPNWQEITEAEFWEEFASISWDMDYRQMLPYDNHMVAVVSARIFWPKYGDDEGLGLVEQYDRETHKHVTPKFYKFYVCDHEWEHVATPFRCYREYVCKKCGATNAIDSSD